MTAEHQPCLSVASLVASLYKAFGGSPDGIIFDCDGVLVDSGPANIHYYNLLRQGVGLPPITPEQERYVQMSTAQQAVDAIIPPALRSALREVTRGISYATDILPLLAPFEGLDELLEACRARGLRLGVDTNRLDGMPALLDKCGLNGVFEPVITAAVVPPKPDPAGIRLILEQWKMPAARVLFLGDSTTDRDAAAAVGVPFLAFRNPDLSPMGCCCSYDELLTALETVWADK